MDISKKAALIAIDNTLHMLKCVRLYRNTLIFFFDENILPIEIESFFRNFFVEIRGPDKKFVKMQKEPLNILHRKVTDHHQLFIQLPNNTLIRNGDIARVHRFQTLGYFYQI